MGSSSVSVWGDDGEVRDDPPRSLWVSPTVFVGQSAIAGRGLFVSSDVEAGVELVRFGGRLVSDDELRALLARAGSEDSYVDTIACDGGRHLVLDDVVAQFGNHSCDPSAWLSGPFKLVAWRPIKSGRGIAVDYATFSTLPEYTMRCDCGSQGCRDVVTGNDWGRVELQRAYGDRWAPAALHLIRSR